MANEVTKSFGNQLQDNLVAVKSALPKDFNMERFINNSIAVLNGNTELQKCSRASVYAGLLKGAFLGLDFMNKECYLVSYNNEATFQASYTGLCKFVKKYSIRPIKDIYAKVVRKGDEFIEKITDGQPSVDFNPKPFNDDEIIGAFAVCLFKDGGMIYEVMTTKDINSVRNNYSRASQSKAWKNSWDQMAIKTVLRRLTKHIETSFESVESQKAWEESAEVDFSNSNCDIDHTKIVNAFEKVEEPEVVVDVEAEVIDVPENFK